MNKNLHPALRDLILNLTKSGDKRSQEVRNQIKAIKRKLNNTKEKGNDL